MSKYGPILENSHIFRIFSAYSRILQCTFGGAFQHTFPLPSEAWTPRPLSQLLLPFLTRNLRRRGGLLDHVVVCLTTGDGDDRAYAAAALTGASFRRFAQRQPSGLAPKGCFCCCEAGRSTGNA